MAGLLNEPAVSDVVQALQHVLGHEAELQVSRAANSHQYGFSLPDVLQQRIDALSCEGTVGASGQTSIAADRAVGFNLPHVTGEVRVSGTGAESCSNFGSLVADTPVGRRVRCLPLPLDRAYIRAVVLSVFRSIVMVRVCRGAGMLVMQIVLQVQRPWSCSSWTFKYFEICSASVKGGGRG